MGSEKTAAIVACATTNFLVMLALIPLSAILPTIADFFGVDAGLASWVQTSYLLTFTSFLLISGRLGDLYGHRNVFLSGMVLFTGVGTVSGFVQDIGPLILLRLVQGVGAALMSGNSLAIITNAFSDRERGTAIGIIGMSASLGALLGVVLSTSLAQYLNWQWLFYFTLPIGMVGIEATRRLKVDFRPEETPSVDYLGAILLAATLSALTLSFSHLHTGEIGSPEGWHYHVGLLAATAVGLLLFAVVESRVPQPMVELRFLLNAPFTSAIVANQILHMTMMASSFLMPFLLEKGMGLSPAHTAGVVIALQVGNIAASPLSGVVYDRTRWRFLCPVAMAFVALGLAVTALFAPAWPYALLLVVNLGLGLGLGFFNTPNNTIIMGTVPAHLRGFAAGMLETSRQGGHTVGISASGALMSVALTGVALDKSAAYIIGFQQASLVAAGIAFLGIFVSLIPALFHREKLKTQLEAVSGKTPEAEASAGNVR